ncbi:hypothetical protein [Inediibacterium massiliense]|uniref:hypothetical protein n=1 Tax=Inediibacterium massiliense TaxID=1658111 RepID=UPI0006B60D20|nr:hypothetical protein [Inediibacterium massiliense]
MMLVDSWDQHIYVKEMMKYDHVLENKDCKLVICWNDDEVTMKNKEMNNKCDIVKRALELYTADCIHTDIVNATQFMQVSNCIIKAIDECEGETKLKDTVVNLTINVDTTELENAIERMN